MRAGAVTQLQGSHQLQVAHSIRLRRLFLFNASSPSVCFTRLVRGCSGCGALRSCARLRKIVMGFRIWGQAAAQLPAVSALYFFARSRAVRPAPAPILRTSFHIFGMLD